MFLFVFLLFSAVALSSNSVFAEDNFTTNECFEEYGLTDADVVAAVKAGDVSAIDSCFWGCYFKKLGYLNDKGEYDPSTYVANMKEFMTGDKSKAYIEKKSHQCDSLKDAVVSDGEAGCEMGALLAACFLEHERKEKGL